MGKSAKKKGKGAEKTAAKTEKKLTQKMKKQLKMSGEEDIEAILAQIEKEEQKKLQVVKKEIASPTPRAFCSLSPHPFKDELVLFGGEYHNGRETFVYNDLFIYKINSNEWTLFKIPGGPAPRTSHQAVSAPFNRGEIWVFGGEFTTKSESQFYHYKDLWVLHLDSLQWEKVEAQGGPTSRSGHRMILLKKQLIVFGGYHDNLTDCKYYNDVYSFSLDDKKWTKLEPSGTPPSPRSGFQMATTLEGKIVVWGGYSKTKVKKDVETGTTHTDMFLLSPEKGDTSGLKWKWSQVKPGGMRYGARSGVSSCFAAGRGYTFGGSTDNETEEDVIAEFFNELHSLDLQKLVWTKINLTGKREAKGKRRRADGTGGDDMACEDGEGQDEEPETKPEEIVRTDGVFEMRIGPAPTSSTLADGPTSGEPSANHPHPRINASVAMKGTRLFLYGGIYENGDKEYTLSDFHSIDTRKFDEWTTLIECELSSQEWVESSSGSESGEDSAESGDDDDDDDEEMDDE